MSTGKMILAVSAISVPVGLLAGFERWSQSSVQLAIAIITVIAVPALLLLSDARRGRRR